MKLKDLITLSALRLNNKTSKRTITAISFGLVMVLLVLWLLFAFHFDMRSQIDSSPVNNVMLVESNAVDDIYRIGTKSQNSYQSDKGSQLTSSQKENLLTMDEEIVWTEFLINVQNKLSDRIKMTINGEQVQVNSEIKCKFIQNATTKTHPESMENYLIGTTGKGAIFGAGFGEEKNELYISERLLSAMDLDKESVVGSVISLEIDYLNIDIANQRYVLDNDTVYDNAHINYGQKQDLEKIDGSVKIFSDYKIVGVISNQYYDINDLTRTDADIWLKDDSLMSEQGTLFPKISIQDLYIFSPNATEAKIVLTYPTNEYIEYSKTVTEQGCFFPFMLGNSYIAENRGSNNNVMPIEIAYVQCDSFQSALSYWQKCGDYIAENTTVANANYYSPCSQNFLKLTQLYNTINMVCIILSVLGAVTLISVLVNYGNVICFNARKRKDYLQMMKKIGITDKQQRTLTNMETFGGLLIALIVAFIVGLLLALIIKAVVSKILTSSMLFASMSLALWPFFVAYLIVAVVMNIIFAIISAGAR